MGWRDNAAVLGAVAGLGAGVMLGVFLLATGTASEGALGLTARGDLEIAGHLLGAVLLGAGYGVLFGRRASGLADSVSGGLLFGLLWWIVGSLTLANLLSGRPPTWSLAEGAASFPALIADLLYGGATGIIFVALAGRRLAVVNPRATVTGAGPGGRRIVIVGGGFGGVSAAQRLERLFGRDPSIEITLVSSSNYLLFTPLLAEVAGGALEAAHIGAPLRAACPRTRVHHAEVEGIDASAQRVHLRTGTTRVATTLAYDHLVIALGSVPNHRGLPGVEANSFALKTLQDATALRDHVIRLLEQADVESDPSERACQLTFVVAGGGFAGVEMIAELFDLVHSVLPHYPSLSSEEPRFMLVHHRDRVLPEISPQLAGYALDTLRDRGIEFRLDVTVSGATADVVAFGDGTRIAARTLVWTAGNQPNPAVATLSDGQGQLPVSSTLQVPGHRNVWAVGDCARVPDPDSDGAAYPPTAQHALREGKQVAENIAATFRGREPKPFRYSAVGVLVALGHRTAVAELRHLRFSGLAAWWLWRTIYLAKLPGAERKLRVCLDWTLDLLFTRDIVLGAAARPPRVAGLQPARRPSKAAQ